MRAIRIQEAGGPEVLELVQRETPRPAPHEVLIRVEAAGINRADLLQRRGFHPAPAGTVADVPGLEVAGVVEAVGGDDRGTVPAHTMEPHPAVGDRVMALLGGGGYAEQVVVHAGLTAAIPDGVSGVAAAAIPEAFFTAFDALLLQARLGAGERVLIHAAGSGVGTAALQIADAAGAAAIFGTASAPKLDRIRTRGLRLDFPIDYESEPFVEVVERETDGRGVEVILDLVGGDYFAENIASLAERGRVLLVGLVGGRTAEADLSAILRKRATVIGTVLRARGIEEKLTLAREFRRRMVPLLESGRLTAVVDRTFPLEEAAEAHRYMEENRNTGKIVLEV